jgi:hypothetical protein
MNARAGGAPPLTQQQLMRRWGVASVLRAALLWLILLGVAWAEGERQALDEAVRRYQLGQVDSARDQLVQLLSRGEGLEPALRQEARVYLGEILFTKGDEQGARSFFEQVLTEEPTYEIDRHPPDVCAYFAYVRLAMVPANPLVDPAPMVVPRAPLSVWAPLGVYDLSHDRPVRGAVHLVAGTGLAISSAALAWRQYQDHHYDTRTGGIGQGGGAQVVDEEEYQRLSRQRMAAIATGIGFYGLWAFSVVDANVHWQQSHRSASLSVGGSF